MSGISGGRKIPSGNFGFVNPNFVSSKFGFKTPVNTGHIGFEMGKNFLTIEGFGLGPSPTALWMKTYPAFWFFRWWNHELTDCLEDCSYIFVMFFNLPFKLI